MSSQPKIGDFVRIRSRRWFVERENALPVDLKSYSLACIDEDAQGETCEIIWDAELEKTVLWGESWSDFGRQGTDPVEVFAAYLRSVKWNTATVADRRLLQAPFRAGIRLDPYQLSPLSKALKLPRVNLLIADDVGLGKTVEAGLIIRELLLRRRVDFVVISAPASMTYQWKDELEQKFGIAASIVDRDYLELVRRTRGFLANPWSNSSFFIISHRLLVDETYTAGLRDVLGNARAKVLTGAGRGPPRSTIEWRAICGRQPVHGGSPGSGGSFREQAVPDRNPPQRALQ